MMEDIGLSVEVRTLETNYSKVPKTTTCAVCGKQFTDPNNCHKHYLRHGQNKGNECEICHHLFQGKQQKLQHMMFEHGVEKYEYKCQICELIFNKMEDLRQHSIDVHDSGDQCRICWLLFKSKEGLQAHMDHHVETNTALPCETCGKYYRDKFSLKLHMRSHTGEKPFECPNCPEKFTARMYLFRHIESKHVKETPYHCELCNVSFKTIIQLRSHVKTKMHVCNQTSNEPKPEKPEVPKPFQCNKCPKSFALQTYLTVHKRIHSGVKPYYCPICSRGFVQVGNMNSHIKRMHQPKISKPEADRLKCSECHKSFCHTRAYKYHMRSHRRSQLHTCRYCDKQFNQLPKFKMHEASHNPDSHIKCHICQKVFFSWGNLNRHKKCCTFKKGRKQKSKSIKKEFAEDSDVDCEDLEEMSDIDEEELNQTLTKIIKSEPVWEGEECVWNTNQPSVQVGRSVLTIKSSRPNLTTTDTTEPSFNTSFSEDQVHETVTSDTDSCQNIITIDQSTDYETGGLKTILANQNISENSRQQSEKWSKPGAELTSPKTSNSKRKHSTQLDRHGTIYNSWQEEVTPSPALLDHFYQIGSPEQPQGPSVSTSSQLYKFLAPESDFTTNQPSGVDATPSLKSSKTISTAHQDNLETAQSVSSILNFMDADDNSTLKTELTEMVNVNEMVQGTVDPSLKNTRIIYFKVHDQLMELQYFDPETEIVEEVATSKDLENVIPSVGTPSDVLDIMSPTTKFIEIKDLAQVQKDNSAYTVPDNGDAQSNNPRVFRIDEYDNRIPPKPLQISTDSMACSICYKPFKDKSNLKHHMKRHNQNKGNECDICRKLFQGRQQVFQHKMAEHNIKPEKLTCEICGVVKAGTNDLRTHSREIHSFDYPYECSFCFKRYKNEQDYETHVEFHIKAYPCDRCDKSYDSAKLLGHHYRSHTGERPHECEMCNKTFILMSHLRAHEMTHLEVRPFLCTYCSKSFNCQRRLNEHQRTHEKEKTPSNGKGRKKSVKNSGRTFTCSMCTKTFQQQTYLTIHMRTHKNERPYSCPVCGKRFGQNGNMLKHWQTHTRQKLTDWLICEICDMKFRSEADYTRHQVTKHLDNSEVVPKVSKRREDPLECSICGDVFATKRSLKQHMEAHEGSNDITCKLCCISVGNNQTLITHLEEYHNAENPFECDVCRRRYSDQSKLDFHVKTHLEKPLTCTHCDKRYSNLKSLQNHMALHREENEYECKICAKKFNIKGNLTRHLKSHNTVGVNSSPLTSVSTNKNVQIVISAEDSYKCVDCEQKFENKEKFLEHVKTHKTVLMDQNV